MATLKVLLDGREIYNLPLARGREYIIGRGNNCDVVLNKSSISRQHMKVFFDGKSWQIELMSTYASFPGLSPEVKNILLNDGYYLIIEGYEIRYLEQNAEKANPESGGQDEQPKEPSQPEFVPTEGSNLRESTDTEIKPIDSHDHTAVATQMSSPCLHSVNEDSGEEILYTLEGNHWVAGRSSSCQIRLTEKKSSRHHFELSRSAQGYELIDLGSSNGTYLNGERLTPQVRTSITLGDEIRVGKTKLIFEMRNSNFDKLLSQISPDLVDETDEDNHRGQLLLPAPRNVRESGPAVIKFEPGILGKFNYKKKKFQVAIGAALIVIMIFSLMKPDENGQIDGASIKPETQQPPVLNTLSAEQKKLADQTYKLAKNLFIQQKYQLAKIEIDKLHQMLPFYLDSRDMEKFINEAIQIESDREMLRLKLEKQKQVATQVEGIASECESKLRSNNKMTLNQMQECLQSATELDPENKKIQDLIDKVTSFEEQRRSAQMAKETYSMQVRKNQNLYNEALLAEKAKNYLKALDLYTKLAQSNLPDPNKNKARARSAISLLNSKIKSEIAQALSHAEELKGQKKFKEAHSELTRAAILDPSDSRILRNMADVESALKKKMKELYNDGVLEENIGNLESAKQKWRAILDQDIKNGDYYKKASSKLRRYGE